MKLELDSEARTLTLRDGAKAQTMPLYSRQAYEALSHWWVKVGWNEKAIYNFTWFGRPIIQLPEDMVRIQEVIYRVRPDVIIETGVAHGGSLIFYASICKAMERGRVVGIDIEIRPHNRKAIEAHELKPLITLLEGSSVDPAIVAQAEALVRPGETVLVLLDSNHTKAHVLAELEAYHGLVSRDSYIVATDGVMQDLTDVPRGKPDWDEDNPAAAAREFAAAHPEFRIEPPPWPFCESELTENITHWPDAYLRRIG